MFAYIYWHFMMVKLVLLAALTITRAPERVNGETTKKDSEKICFTFQNLSIFSYHENNNSSQPGLLEGTMSIMREIVDAEITAHIAKNEKKTMSRAQADVTWDLRLR
ncbi:hypothetical protein JOM56_014088 [Amanita muscaria]